MRSATAAVRSGETTAIARIERRNPARNAVVVRDFAKAAHQLSTED